MLAFFYIWSFYCWNIMILAYTEYVWYQIYSLHVYSPLVWTTFSFSWYSFETQVSNFNGVKYIFFSFSLSSLVLLVSHKAILPNGRLKNFSKLFSSKCFMLLAFAFVLIPFVLIFAYCIRKGSRFILFKWMSHLLSQNKLLRREYKIGLLFHPSGDLPNPGSKWASPALASRFFTTSTI